MHLPASSKCMKQRAALWGRSASKLNHVLELWDSGNLGWRQGSGNKNDMYMSVSINCICGMQRTA